MVAGGSVTRRVIRIGPLVVASVLLSTASIVLVAQRRDAFDLSFAHPAIEYQSRPTTDAVAGLAASLQRGEAKLSFDPANGYLRALLEQLRVPIESQVIVFSGGSKQADLISAKNPRAIFFNDSVAIGWVRDAPELEIAAADPEQGAIFYTLEQRASDRPVIQRAGAECLQCHVTWETRGVPGFVVMSTLNEPAPDDKYSYATGSFADHRSPFSDRWGGWYVTGSTGSVRHLGNDTALPGRKGAPAKPPRQLGSLDGLFEPRGFPSMHSDVAALLVLEHQSTMLNLLTWTNWEARVGLHSASGQTVAPSPPGRGSASERLSEAVTALVDYMLFVDEAPLPNTMAGSTKFGEMFTATGPRDSKGRSLRQLDLRQRLQRFPCSYVIYSAGFDRLPASTKQLVYERMWRILSGQASGAPYDRLAREDRQAVIEILRETKNDLPDVFARGSIVR